MEYKGTRIRQKREERKRRDVTVESIEKVKDQIILFAIDLKKATTKFQQPKQQKANTKSIHPKPNIFDSTNT